MKTKILISTLLFLTLSFIKVNAQTPALCGTPNHSSNKNFNTMLRAPNQNSYCVRIYMHVIRRSDHTGGQTVSAVNQAFQILNDDYNSHGIRFVWENQTIDYINNDNYYDNPNLGEIYPDIPPSIFSVNNHTDGIDIYLFDNLVTSVAGKANGIGESSEFYVIGNYVTTHTISHEMGHVLFLYHTHHGTFDEGGDDNPCAELVDGSNSDICGDYIEDTPADPNLYLKVDSSCNWTGIERDTLGNIYNPDTHNIMSYSPNRCREYFSPEQGQRARNALATLPFLQQTLTYCCVGTNLDLFMRDGYNDDGTEPNTVTKYLWNSKDIWVRQNDDGGLRPQNPIYKGDNDYNYIYVRVKNRSCVNSPGLESLRVYWAKTSTYLYWLYYWNDVSNGIYPFGGEILVNGVHGVRIPPLSPGEETIVKIPWIVPNPADYTNGVGSDSPWNFSLLAKIESPDDTMTYPMSSTHDINMLVRNNNNLAMKNVSVINPEENTPRASVLIGNPFNSTKAFYLELIKDDNETGKAIYDEAEITLTMDDNIYNAWVRGGKQSQLLEDKATDEKSKIIKGNNVTLNNLIFDTNENGLITLNFNFLTKEVTDKQSFTYHMIQKDSTTDEVIGGVTFIIQKNQRPIFIANAGNDTEVDQNETITISAEDINEAAVYNWYDTDGNLIYQGKDLTISADVTKKYKLEIITDTDGYKDYAEVEVKIKPSRIDNISPNPSSNNIQVDYKINEASSAYLMIIGQNVSNNYVLDLNDNQITIDVSNYDNAYYTVALVCDGQIVDAKTFLKN